MKRAFLLLAAAACVSAAAEGVKTYEGTLTIPTYQHSARETEPPLFANSTLTGLYPFTTYVMPFRPGDPKPRTYRALFVENEYLKLTYIPEFGGRIFSLFDKLRGREVFYRNDVIKPAPYNPRSSWPQSGLELTGPHDLHMLTLYGEPYWANHLVRRENGAVSLFLGEIDPVYGMKVNLSATLHPGVAALEIGVFCYNPNDVRMPQMLWINTAIDATAETRFIYPMSRTVGHTTAEIADWPLYNGIDYSRDRNNKHMLGVFGIDIYDDFQGAYQFDRDYGIFRYADRRIVQGAKLWTFGYGEGAQAHERGYTDKAGPYVELQSGRHVWDGHYEWVEPHKAERWTEWWVPVAQTGGLTTLTRDVALNLDIRQGSTRVVLAATRSIPGAVLTVASGGRELLRKEIALDPRAPVQVEAPGGPEPGLTVTVRDVSGAMLLEYRRPDAGPGRKEYTPFTRPLEQPRKAPEQMSAEELAIAAEFKFKELDPAGARTLLERALKLDPGYSRAHLLLGIDDFRAGRPAAAVEHLQTAIGRDPYADAAYYYLAMSQLALQREREAERNLYFIWSGSAHFAEREYHLGRLALLRDDPRSAVEHLRRSVRFNGDDLLAWHALAVAFRESGERAQAEQALAELERIDPTSRTARAERWFLSGAPGARSELVRLLGGQTQEAIGVSVFYRDLRRWREAARILRLAEEENADPWGAAPEFFYTVAYCERRAGNAAAAEAYRKKARAHAANIDRFPYRASSEGPLAEAVELDGSDAVARFALGCLLYFRDRPQEAIAQWEAAAAADQKNFSIRRALGLAYAEQGLPLERAAAQLEQAVSLNPRHVRTRNDLSNLYARAGRFDEQLAVIEKALAASPGDDDLIEAALTAHLVQGRYDEAERLLLKHPFAPRHRSYGLRDKYRAMRYGQGGQAFRRGDYARALQLFDQALQPPASLGVDDFAGQAPPRQQYYRGLALAALGRNAQAAEAWEQSIAGIKHLSGDRDSWSAENFFMVLALDRLGRKDEAAKLAARFEQFAAGDAESRHAGYRARARYVMALVRKWQGRQAESRALLEAAIEAMPDFLPARLELRGDVPDAGAK